MFQEILTDRLRLRRLREGDATAILTYRSLPALQKFLSWPKSEEIFYSTVDELSKKEFGSIGWDQFTIERIADNCIVGDCALRIDEKDARIAELGIALAPDYHSQGYASETMNALFKVLFTKLGVHRVFTSVDPSNTSSMALMERLGMRKEGHFKQSLWFRDEWVDDVIYGLLSSEWHERNGAPTN